MGTPKLTDQPWDIPPPEPGLIVAYISMYGFADDEGDHILRVETVVCVPDERLIVSYKSWDLVEPLKDADFTTLVTDYCAARGVQKLQFHPTMLSMAETSTGECPTCGGLSCRLPWTRDRALW